MLDFKSVVVGCAITVLCGSFAAAEPSPTSKDGLRARFAALVGKKNTHFIGTRSIYLNENGQPRTELFVGDQLHLNRDGYIRWARRNRDNKEGDQYRKIGLEEHGGLPF